MSQNSASFLFFVVALQGHGARHILARVQAACGWTRCVAQAMSSLWSNVQKVHGENTTVCTLKMQGSPAILLQVDHQIIIVRSKDIKVGYTQTCLYIQKSKLLTLYRKHQEVPMTLKDFAFVALSSHIFDVSSTGVTDNINNKKHSESANLHQGSSASGLYLPLREQKRSVVKTIGLFQCPVETHFNILDIILIFVTPPHKKKLFQIHCICIPIVMYLKNYNLLLSVT